MTHRTDAHPAENVHRGGVDRSKALGGLGWARQRVFQAGKEQARGQAECWASAWVWLRCSVQSPGNQCSFLKHCCLEPPSLPDSRLGVKYLSIYKATPGSGAMPVPHRPQGGATWAEGETEA